MRRLFGRLNEKIGDKYPLIYMENLECQVIQMLRENPLKGTFYTLVVRNNKDHPYQQDINLKITLPGFYRKTKMLVYSDGHDSIHDSTPDTFGYVKARFIESNLLREFCDIKCHSKGNTLNFTKMPFYSL